MTTKTKSVFLIAAAAFAFIGTAPAMAAHNGYNNRDAHAQVPHRVLEQPRSFGFDDAQQRIHHRIVQGIRSGHLTRHEADVLFAKEKRIERQEFHFKSDGRISTYERRSLREELAELSDDVERKLSNRRTR